MIYVVLAVGKTGSSLIAETLHKSGIPMGIDEKHGELYPLGVKRTTYEDYMFKYINKRLKEGLDMRDKAMVVIKERCANAKDWGFKDPRTIEFYDTFWIKVLPRHKRIVLTRDISEVIEHYRRQRDDVKRDYVYEKAVSDRYEALYKSMDKYRRNRDTLFIDYHEFMYGNDLPRLEKFVKGHKLLDLRDPEKHHCRKGGT